MTLDTVLQELRETLRQREPDPYEYDESPTVAAISLQAIAATNSEFSAEARATLMETFFSGKHPPAFASAEGMAYLTCSGEHTDRVLDAFDEGLQRDDVGVRTAAIVGLGKVAEVNPDAAERVAPRLGAALEQRLTELVARYDDVDSVHELSAERVRSHRSCREAAYGLIQAESAAPEAVAAVFANRTFPGFLEDVYRRTTTG